MTPRDPIILLSYVNTLLRDQFKGLDSLCDYIGMGRNELVGKLGDAGFEYNESLNQFK